MPNEKLIAFLLKMSSLLIGIRPERRAAAMYRVANQLNEMAAELLSQCDCEAMLVVAPEPGLNAPDIESVLDAGFVHGSLIGEEQIVPGLQDELHPCADCEKTLWTCSLVLKPGESPKKPLCGPCLEKRFPSIVFPWSRK